MRGLLASPLGFLIGVSLGALGGGGSILAVPALVYAAGQSPRHATTTSLVLVTFTAMIGLIPHWRARHVRFAAGTVFGLAGIGGSLLGSHWNASADPNVLLLAFSGLMILAATGMWVRARPVGAAPVERSVGAAVGPQVRGVHPLEAAPLSAPREQPTARAGVRVDPRTALKVIGAGSGVGVLTGFFGVGGGFVIVPALVLALGFAMTEAVGTSLLVIAINSVVALSTRLQAGSIEWATVLPFTIASAIGVVVGGRLARRHDPTSLQRWFVGLLVVVAVYTAIRSVLALT
jgi:uncharacterized membrane protein YfcA